MCKTACCSKTRGVPGAKGCSKCTPERRSPRLGVHPGSPQSRAVAHARHQRDRLPELKTRECMDLASVVPCTTPDVREQIRTRIRKHVARQWSEEKFNALFERLADDRFLCAVVDDGHMVQTLWDLGTN